MNEVVLGIDLGTSNSVVSVMLENEAIVIPDAAGNRIHPSLVYFFEDGQTVVGNDARA
jgi:molecular chaperone DnaK